MKTRARIFAMLMAAALVFSACEEVIIEPRGGEPKSSTTVASVNAEALQKLEPQR